MPSIVTGIKLIDSIDQIERKIIRAFVDEINDRFPKAVQGIQSSISNNIKGIFVNTPTYSDLVSGPLGQHFGIPQREAINKLDKIIDTLASSVKVDCTKVTFSGKNGLRGGITVYAFIEDFSDILQLSEAQVKTNKNQNLPWLNWLLIQGDRIIITDYEIGFGNFPTSRAGGALMVEKTGGLWRVPIQYSGTPDDNWITRAIDASSVFLEDLIGAAIKYNVEKVL